jgi:hypothetical protein
MRDRKQSGEDCGQKCRWHRNMNFKAESEDCTMIMSATVLHLTRRFI